MSNDGLRLIIRGERETIDFLRGLGDAIIRGPGGGPVGKSLREAGEPLARQIEAAAPVESGVLRRSIKLSRMKGRNRYTINYGLVMRAVRTAAARKRSKSKSMVPFYWYFLEYGWVSKSGRRHQKPFIRPVVYSQFDATIDRFAGRLAENLKPLGFR